MAKEQLSDKQQQILEFIKRRILDKGYPPAVREICEAVNLRSTSSVHSHLETLERKGYIHRDPTKPRAIEITDDDFNLALAYCPGAVFAQYLSVVEIGRASCRERV